MKKELNKVQVELIRQKLSELESKINSLQSDLKDLNKAFEFEGHFIVPTVYHSENLNRNQSNKIYGPNSIL